MQNAQCKLSLINAAIFRADYKKNMVKTVIHIILYNIFNLGLQLVANIYVLFVKLYMKGGINV